MAMSRRTRLVVLGLSTVLLAAASWVAVRGVSQLSHVRAEGIAARSELGRLRNLMPLVEEQERYGKEAEAFQAVIDRAGLDPSLWANRRVQHAVSVMPRQDAERLLSQQVDRQGGQWFAAERFDAAVVSQGAGLFTPADADDRGFSVEMTGKVFFPLDVK
jgi:hypothetical protein